MNKLLLTNARLINEGQIRDADVLIEGERIAQMVIVPVIQANFNWVTEFAEQSQRGAHGAQRGAQTVIRVVRKQSAISHLMKKYHV